jgi:hypothetical protein
MDKYREMGLKSGELRQPPELVRAKNEAIRLHTQFGFGCASIGRYLKRNKGGVQRWLVAAGVYRARPRGAVKYDDDLSKLPEWNDIPVQTKPIYEASDQLWAWRDEWKGMRFWDDNFYWIRHKYVFYFQNKRSRDKWYKYKPNYLKHQTLEWKMSQAWEKEWHRAHIWDDHAYWMKHEAVRKYRRQKWLRENPNGKIACNLRIRIGHAMRAALANKSASTDRLIGCTWPAFFKHIESKFKPGMSWDNYATYWEIDHVKPCAAFDLRDKKQQFECFNYKNSRPETLFKNRSKNSKYKGVRHLFPRPTPAMATA